MAGVVGYRKTVWDNATNAQRAFLRAILNAVKLGQPALIDDGTGVEWYVFADVRIDRTFVENLGWANTALPAITTQPVRSYQVPEGSDPLFLASQAQGNTPWFAAAQSLPDGWFPVQVV